MDWIDTAGSSGERGPRQGPRRRNKVKRTRAPCFLCPGVLVLTVGNSWGVPCDYINF